MPLRNLFHLSILDLKILNWILWFLLLVVDVYFDFDNDVVRTAVVAFVVGIDDAVMVNY